MDEIVDDLLALTDTIRDRNVKSGEYQETAVERLAIGLAAFLGILTGLRLVAVESNSILASKSGSAGSASLFADVRGLVLELLGMAGWVSAETATEIGARAGHSGFRHASPDAAREFAQRSCRLHRAEGSSKA